jgi:L-threonylcarbamoyladenylate synthase
LYESAASPDQLELIRAGGLVIFPTETIYGLGCIATDAEALERLFAAKGRAPGQPPPVLIDGEAMLSLLVSAIPPAARALMQAHWPGGLTLVLPARSGLPERLTGRGPDGLTIGVRHSAHPVAQALCRGVGLPIVATSANLSGATGAAAAPRRIGDVPAELIAAAAVVIDGGEVAGRPSTIVDCTAAPPRILRQGAVVLLPITDHP